MENGNIGSEREKTNEEIAVEFSEGQKSITRLENEKTEILKKGGDASKIEAALKIIRNKFYISVEK